jgi:FtsH-binding integral membrane protein
LIVLLLFTACEAVLVGTISAMYDTQVVLIAAVMTVGITACLTLYALQTKRDFTAAGG